MRIINNNAISLVNINYYLIINNIKKQDFIIDQIFSKRIPS